jgi:protein O-GlcNAc transferase
MPITPAQIQEALNEANAALSRGSIARADLICQSAIARGIRSPDFILIQGRVAVAIGEYATARRCFEELLAVNPSDSTASTALSDLSRLEDERRALDASTASAASNSPKRFHLIKAWGFGFTADVDHTLGHLLLAEITGRIPVIYWGGNSLFRDENIENAWGEFFEPVSPFTVRDLCRDEHTFFSSKWNAGNLMEGEINKMAGPGSRTAAIWFLNQSASVTVGDFFTSVLELLPWVAATHPVSAKGPIKASVIETAYRYLIGKYLKPRSEILAAVESFAARNFQGKAMLAVHVRGSDKAGELANLADGQAKLLEEVKAILDTKPTVSVFLMTDEAAIREQYMSAFPGRVITTECVRTRDIRGVHYLRGFSRRQLGIEVLIDVYLAARCDGLLGLGFTNVSNFILHLKPWRQGTVRLLGPVLHYERNFMLHA